MEVKIYTTPTSKWCIEAMKWLKKKRVSFQELDTTESDTYRDEILEKTNQLATPVFDINGTIIVGFHKDKIEKIIKKIKSK